MATFLNRLILLLGFISLFHAAYSAVQHRSFLRINEQKFTHLPPDIIIQAVTSLLTIMYGVIHTAGDFREIKASAELENKSWETYRNIPSFYSFNHRGKALSGYYSPQDAETIN